VNAAATQAELADVKETANEAKQQLDPNQEGTFAKEVKEDLTSLREIIGKVPDIGRAVENIRATFYHRMKDYVESKNNEAVNEHNGLGKSAYIQQSAIKKLQNIIPVNGDNFEGYQAADSVIEKLHKQHKASLFTEAVALSPTPYQTPGQKAEEAEVLRKYSKL